MRIFKLPLSLLAFVASLFVVGATPALADFNVCNRSDRPFIASVRAGEGVYGQMGWRTAGWISFNRGQCKTVWTGDSTRTFFLFSVVFVDNNGQYKFAQLNNTVELHCGSVDAYDYRGTLRSCPRNWIKMPFYRYESNTYNKTLYIN
jgi:uncharacterized membrane protein